MPGWGQPSELSFHSTACEWTTVIWSTGIPSLSARSASMACIKSGGVSPSTGAPAVGSSGVSSGSGVGRVVRSLVSDRSAVTVGCNVAVEAAVWGRVVGVGVAVGGEESAVREMQAARSKKSSASAAVARQMVFL
jgi:hypothetical protein